MAGISRFEKGVLLLTAGFVLFTGGWFLAGQNTSEPYTVTVSAPQEPSAPDPALQEAPAEGERPDSLLPGEVIDLNAADAYDLTWTGCPASAPPRRRPFWPTGRSTAPFRAWTTCWLSPASGRLRWRTCGPM